MNTLVGDESSHTTIRLSPIPHAIVLHDDTNETNTIVRNLSNGSILSQSVIPFVYGRSTNCINASDDKNIHGGILEFYHPVLLESILQQPNQYPVSPCLSDIIESPTRIVCLMNVPAFMIPTDIIHYFGGSINDILSMRILQHYDRAETYMILIHLISLTATKLFLQHYSGQLLTSLEPTICVIYGVKNIVISDPKMLSKDLNIDTISAIVGTTHVELTKVVGTPSTPQNTKRFLSGLEYSALSPRKISITASMSTSASAAADDRAILIPEEERCVLCLETISNDIPKTFTTCCQHTFHIECISKVETPQCPVCRFQHDSTSSDLSCCFVCGWQGLQSVPNSPTHGSINTIPEEQNRDLWVCLVCGFIGCGHTRDSHIHRHYEEHLHTYAMNTDTGRVWDFAGDGYVHRLILSQADEAVETTQQSASSIATDDYETDESNIRASLSIQTSGIQSPSNRSGRHPINISPRYMKVVEVTSPTNQSAERSQIAPLTTVQEERIINAKLEATAYHYNQLIHWQLDRTREIYEMRLQRVREFVEREGILPPPPNTDQSSISWADCVLHSLNQEKNKILKQYETAKTRLKKLQDEIDFNIQFQQNLQSNHIEYQQRIDQARKQLIEAEREYRETIPPLQRQVQAIMERLDQTGG